MFPLAPKWVKAALPNRPYVPVYITDYRNFHEVKDQAERLKTISGLTQYIVQYPNRTDYSITMMPELAKAKGAEIVWKSK